MQVTGGQSERSGGKVVALSVPDYSEEYGVGIFISIMAVIYALAW